LWSPTMTARLQQRLAGLPTYEERNREHDYQRWIEYGSSGHRDWNSDSLYEIGVRRNSIPAFHQNGTCN
jgi:hypothetical protein